MHGRQWAWQELAFLLGSRPSLCSLIFCLFCHLRLIRQCVCDLYCLSATGGLDGRWQGRRCRLVRSHYSSPPLRLSDHSSHPHPTRHKPLDHGERPHRHAYVQPLCSSFTPSAYIHFTKYLRSLLTSESKSLHYSRQWSLSHMCYPFLTFVNPSQSLRSGT